MTNPTYKCYSVGKQNGIKKMNILLLRVNGKRKNSSGGNDGALSGEEGGREGGVRSWNVNNICLCGSFDGA